MLHNRRLIQQHPAGTAYRADCPEEKKVPVVSLGFDIIEIIKSEAAAVFQNERVPLKKLALVQSGAKVRKVVLSGVRHLSGKAYHALVRAASTAMVQNLDKNAAALGRHVVVFEGAKDILIQEMALTASAPDQELIQPLEKLLASNRENMIQVRKTADYLRTVNVESRVASAMERVMHVMTRLDASVELLLEITREGVGHADVLRQIHQLHAALDDKIARYDEDVEFDPELVALADAALERISASAKAKVRA